jgi:hypothetical protein
VDKKFLFYEVYFGNRKLAILIAKSSGQSLWRKIFYFIRYILEPRSWQYSLQRVVDLCGEKVLFYEVYFGTHRLVILIAKSSGQKVIALGTYWKKREF